MHKVMILALFFCRTATSLSECSTAGKKSNLDAIPVSLASGGSNMCAGIMQDGTIIAREDGKLLAVI